MCIAITNSTILGPLLRIKGSQGGNFTIGSFEFSMREVDDFRKYIITRNDVSFPFQILTIDTSKECGPHSNLNLVEFIWNYLALLRCRMYVIVAIHSDNSRILYIKHIGLRVVVGRQIHNVICFVTIIK